jgi:hypothetical protein
MAKLKQRTIQRRKTKAAWRRLVANSFNEDPLMGIVTSKASISADTFKPLFWFCVGAIGLVLVTGIVFAP